MTMTWHLSHKIGHWLVESDHMTYILASHWSRMITWSISSPLIGRECSHNLYPGLGMVKSDHMIYILASDWSRVLTWPKSWPLIGCCGVMTITHDLTFVTPSIIQSPQTCHHEINTFLGISCLWNKYYSQIFRSCCSLFCLQPSLKPTHFLDY